MLTPIQPQLQPHQNKKIVKDKLVADGSPENGAYHQHGDGSKKGFALSHAQPQPLQPHQNKEFLKFVYDILIMEYDHTPEIDEKRFASLHEDYSKKYPNPKQAYTSCSMDIIDRDDSKERPRTLTHSEIEAQIKLLDRFDKVLENKAACEVLASNNLETAIQKSKNKIVLREFEEYCIKKGVGIAGEDISAIYNILAPLDGNPNSLSNADINFFFN